MIWDCIYRKNQLTGWIFIFTILVGIFVFLINTVFAIEYGGIGGRPAFPRDDNPRTESIFIHTLKPGSIQEEGVLAINNTDEEKTLFVYGVDSSSSSSGSFACNQMVEPKNGVGSWIKLDQTEITLNANSSKIIPFIISVPQSAGVGEHNGCIAIQEKKEVDKTKTGMRLSFRTALRVAITIPGNIIRKLEIVDFRITKREDGIFLLSPIAKNIGNVSIDADIQVITNNFFGSKYIQHGGEFPILRGEVADWNFQLKKPFWGGWYKSNFFIEYEEDLGASIGVETGNEKVRLQGPSIWFFSSPKPLALTIEIAVFLAILLIIISLCFIIRRKKKIKKTWVDYEVKLNDDINILAKKFNVKWKLLAKANKLKPPYSLKSGEKIKVPPVLKEKE